MKKETIRIIEQLRNISKSEWDEIIKILNLKGIDEENKNEKLSGKQLNERVRIIINELGIPASIKGYKYIQRAIILGIENPEMAEKLTKSLYPTIAEEYGTTKSGVETGIRHAIDVTVSKGNIEMINEILGNKINKKGRITNSLFIAEIIEYVKMR